MTLIATCPFCDEDVDVDDDDDEGNDDNDVIVDDV